MNKINFYLESRLEKIRKQAKAAAEKSRIEYADAFKKELDFQVKYGRRGYRRYDSANYYNAAGDLCPDSLDNFDAVPIQDVSRHFDYTGYYSDNFEHDLCRPYIVKIKTSRGLFIAPAIDHSEWDGARIYLSRGQLVEKGGDENAQQCAAYDCAKIADRIAEREAEEGREYDAKFQAENLAEELKHENKKAREYARELLQGVRDQRRYSNILAPICGLIQDKLRELRADIRRNNAKIAALNDNYWLAVQ